MARATDGSGRRVRGGTLPAPALANLPEVLLRAADIDRPVLHLTPDDVERSSHRALLTAARRVCGGLRARGVEPGRRVVVVLDRSAAVLPVFWGSLLAGAVPLVMEVPERFEAGHKAYDQLVAVIAKLGAPLVVVEDDRVDALPGAVGLSTLAAGPVDPTPHRAALDDLAFLCFSSGSTGDPKCTMLTHRCVLQRNAGANRHNGHRADDVNLNWLPFDHIGSLTEHIRSLTLGCAVVYVGKDHVLEDPLRLLDIIDAHRVTHTWGPNFIYALIARALGERAARLPADRWDLSCVRFLISGGEAASRTAMGEFLERAGRFGFPQTGFRPSFGMVEVSAGITYYAPTPARPLGFVWLDRVGVPGEPVQRVAEGHPGARPYALLGRPIPGCDLQVVDGDGRPVPEGVVGRVQFSGAALAAGYLDDPVRTAATFRADGWLETGDLGCVLDGELVLTGRTKDILIINGVNYDCRALEEIVDGVPGVALSFTAACAVADPTGRAGERLAIFFSPAADADVGAVVRAAREALVKRAGINPHHVVPLAADAVPKTPIGKIRRAELTRRFDRGDYGAGWSGPATTAAGRAPRTPIEAALVEIWQAVLDRPVTIDDHFFEVGGDSIKAVNAVGRMQQRLAGLQASISLFDTPTVARLADWLEAQPGAIDLTDAELVRVRPAPAEATEPFPLTAIQQAYWAGRSTAFTLGGRSVHAYCEFEGRDLDPERLAASWNAMIARHPNLRTVIRDGRQQVLPEVPRYAMPVADLRALDADARDRRLTDLRAGLSHGVLSCDTWPTFDVRLALLPDDRVRVYTRFDALFFDARSRFIVFGEWQRLYAGEALPPLELTFRDYVLQAETVAEPLDHDRQYWLDRLEDLPRAPDLPLAAQPRSLGTPRFVQLERRIDRATWTRLQGGAARFGITPSGLLLAVFADALRPWSQNDRFLLNLTTYRRLPVHPQVNDVVGDFSALTLLAVEPPEGDFVARARALQGQLMRDLAHGTFGGVEVLRALARRRPDDLLAPVVFTSVLGDELQAPGGTVTDWLGEVVHDITQTPQIFFDHIAFEEGGALQIRWNVVEGLFAPGLIEAVFAATGHHLDALAADDAAWTASWAETRARLLPPAEASARARYNETAVAVQPELLHAGFERQARLTPDRPAVIADDRTLTYGALAAAAHRVGHHLIAHGARPGELVAVAMSKGWGQIVGVLGVLNAGAAYLPVSPDLPAARLAAILEQGRVERVLVLGSTDLPVPAGVEVIAIDGAEVAARPTTAPTPRQTPTDLAYVIFTSGSTGRPKGVMIDHRGAHNTCVDINRRFAVGPDDRVLALSALNFDLSVYDIFGLLAVGGAIVMPRPGDVREPRRWAELVEAHRVTIWNTVPAFVDVLLDDAAARAPQLATLRVVMMSGDWIPLTVPPKIAALPGRPRAISLGGATEASIWSIWHPIERLEPHWTSVPYGRPLDNQTFFVLDDALAPCPVGVPGMLYIGGVGVALGYFGDAERTAAAFIEHPATGERLYRTGDRGRWVAGSDGHLDIEFLGRVDLQVKVQGFRVELGDIEAALGRHPAVEQAVVIARGDRHADKVLVAYVVGSPPVDALRNHLVGLLPAYMVPARFVVLDRLPLTANGKVDRKALPEPAAPVPAPVAAKSAAAGPIAALVAEVLERAVPADADLFDLGATSVDIMRIVNRIEARLGLTVPVAAVFEDPSIAGIAAAAGLEPATDADLLARYPAIVEPAERDAFGRAEHGLRRIDGPAVQLDRTVSPELERLLAERRSHRRFAPSPLPVAALGALLAGLRRFEEEGRPRYAHGSAGGLYPVQVGVYARPGRVFGLEGGFYHLDRKGHRLVRLAAADGFDDTVYGPAERTYWAEAAFGLFLMADLRAIVPMYREASLRFAHIEAGLMCQLLEMLAPGAGIGLCQTGQLAFDRLRSGFAVAQDHRLVHAVMGGPLPDDDDRVEEEF